MFVVCQCEKSWDGKSAFEICASKASATVHLEDGHMASKL